MIMFPLYQLHRFKIRVLKITYNKQLTAGGKKRKWNYGD